MKRVRIDKNIEKSTVAGSTPITNASNELNYVSPGTLGQQLEINASGVPEYKSTLTTLKTVNRAFSKIGSGQATNNDAVALTDDIYHTGKLLVGISTDDGTGSKIQTNGNISNIVAGGKIVNGSTSGGNNQVISQSTSGKVGILANSNNWLGANGDLHLSANIDFDTFSSPFTSIKIVNSSKNVLIKKLTDSGFGDLQVPKISLGYNTWHNSEDGVERIYFAQNSTTYLSAPTGFPIAFKINNEYRYRFYNDSFNIYNDGLTDITFAKSTLPLSSTVRDFILRKEANNQDFRFFDYDGTTARDWWKVFTQTNRFELGNLVNIIHSSKVGIGTTTPNDFVEVVNSNPVIRITNSTTGSGSNISNGSILFTSNSNGSHPDKGASIVSTKNYEDDGDLRFSTSWGTSRIERLVIDFYGRIGIGTSTPNQYNILDVVSTDKGSRPFPSMTQAQRTALNASTPVGTHVYQTDGTEGIYVKKSSGWVFAY